MNELATHSGYPLHLEGTLDRPLSRYPPFTLADGPDFPARLNVEYPQALSRGLVLVKWWLLALLRLDMGGPEPTPGSVEGDAVAPDPTPELS
jgi:hypothetical protein